VQVEEGDPSTNSRGGIRIFGFKDGLLHTKSIVVNRQFAVFGSVNLDVRSFWLDFEVTLGVYDPDFAERLLALQDKYIEPSIPVDLQTRQQRPAKERFIENLTRLASPLLKIDPIFTTPYTALWGCCRV